MPNFIGSPTASELATMTSSTVGASLRPDSASSVPRSECGMGTLRSTEKIAAASVGDATAPSSIAIQIGSPRT